MALRKRLIVATLLAIVGSIPACSNLASLGIGLTLDPVGFQVTVRSVADVPAYTITTPATQPGPATTVPATTQPIVIAP